MSGVAARTDGGRALAVELDTWRDADPEVLAVPGVHLGRYRAGAAADGEAERLWDRGVRRVRLVDPVLVGSRHDAAAAVRRLVLVRELTARTVAVDWELQLDAGAPPWRALSHLHPPAGLSLPDGTAAGTAGSAADDVLQAWSSAFHLGLCVHRMGPGFVQVRDRRTGQLRRFTIDEPEYLRALTVLLPGADATAVPDDVRSVLEDEDLVVRVGRLLFWAPYRVRRWPLSPLLL